MLKEMILRYRLFLIFGFQSVLIAVAFMAAYLFRFDFSLPQPFLKRAIEALPFLFAVKLLIFWQFGLFRSWWRYVSIAELLTIARANTLASLALGAVLFIIFRLEDIPRSVVVLDGVICFLLLGGARFLIRAFRENYFPMLLASYPDTTKVIIYGAGEAGAIVSHELRARPDLGRNVVGFIDDDPMKKDLKLDGFPVLGSGKELVTICQKLQVNDVILAMPSATGQQIRSIVEEFKSHEIHFQILPGVGDLINGKVTVQQIRDISLEDLLGREPVQLDAEAIADYLQGKRVLITGAGGSIGSELCRQVIDYKPQQMILYDQAETPLFFIGNELAAINASCDLISVIGDVCSRSRLQAVMDKYRPDVVFHAAAYKHVPMMELNAAEAINTNVQGTRNVAEAAEASGVKHFVMISTDKAVNPTNIMGASKRAAEIFVQNLAQKSQTRFVTVRFGNVLGSSGSVVPIFQQQISDGGPVTVTDPEVTRYFMTIPEATQLVLQAGSMGHGGEIYLLDMGEPVKILTLAEELIRLSGYHPYEDIDIAFTGLRPGEKLYEELLLEGEGVQATPHQKIKIARSVNYEATTLMQQFEALYLAAQKMDEDQVKNSLSQIVPEYTPWTDLKEPARTAL